MFRAVRRSSSGAPIVFAASGLHTHVVTARSQVKDLTTGGHHMRWLFILSHRAQSNNKRV